MNWTVGRRITASFVLALVPVVTTALVGGWALRAVSRAHESVLRAGRGALLPALEAEAAVRDANVHDLRFLLTREERFLTARDSLLRNAAAALEQLRAAEDAPDIRAQWIDAAALLARWDEGAAEALAAARSGDLAEALGLRQAGTEPVHAALDAALARGIELVKAKADLEIAAAEQAARRSHWVFGAGALLAFAVGLLSTSYLNRAVRLPLRRASRALATRAAELLATMRQQATGAAESLEAVTETAATVDEVAQTAERAVERARGVANASQRAAEIGRQGREAVENAIAAVEQVREHVESFGDSILDLAGQAQAIGEISEAVTDFAEQANLLALSAAIEAARAGEHGRGFAVVAAEVKGLAEQSKSAAARIREILEEVQRATGAAVTATEQGTRRVAASARQFIEAGELVRSLADAITEAAQAAAQIAAFAGQQSVEIARIREALGNIQRVAQRHFPAMKQSETMARDLNRLCSHLLRLVGDSPERRANVPIQEATEPAPVAAR